MNYTYDSLARLDTVTVEGKTFDYEFYPDGMLKAVNYPTTPGGQAIRSEYTYDNVNRLKTVINKVGTGIISQYSYGYDNNGNITSVTENGVTTECTYDDLNRLEGISRPDGEEISYSYDTRGNRTELETNNEISTDFISGTFAYNNWDQLSQYTSGTTSYQYKYDPEGLRTRKESTGGTVRYHLDDNGRVIAESNASGQVTAQNIWGHKALARKVGGAYYYYIYNGHGDVVQVLDTNGNIVNSYTYDEWGNILSQTEQIFNPIRYGGEYYDQESGLYYLRARYYDPSIGRFISEDTDEGQLTNPLSLNLYTYCASDPLNYSDYTGKTPVAVIYMYCASVASSPDTQLDMQCVALDLSQGKYFTAAFDSAGVLIPGATGLGRAADNVAAKVLRFFGRKTREEIAAIKETFGSGKVVMSYKYLKQIVKGTGLETHHLIEKRFAKALNINPNDILSIAIDKKTHKQITRMFRERIGYACDLRHRIRTTNASAQDVWDATEYIYKELGMEQYLAPLKQQLINSGANIDF